MNRDALLPLCRTYGDYHGVPWHILAALAFHESRFNPRAVSEVGAQGLTQFMPDTWRDVERAIAVENPFDPDDAIAAAAWYLAWLRSALHPDRRDNWGWVLAAYVWGIGNVINTGEWDDAPTTVRQYTRLVLTAAELLKLWEGE